MSIRIHFLVVLSILLISISLHAATITNPSDDFSSPTLDTNLWIASTGGISIPSQPQGARDIYHEIYDGSFRIYRSGGSVAGGAQLKTNYYFSGDFDATVEMLEIEGGALFASFRFFTYGETVNPGDIGTKWGYAGDGYGWFPESTWYYSGSDDCTGGIVYEYRITRIGDDIYTYYREKGTAEWGSPQNSYIDFGTAPVYLAIVGGDNNSGAIDRRIDNYSVIGIASGAVIGDSNAIPEPATLILMALALIKFFLRK